MHFARSLHLQNVVVFGDVSLRLDKNPLTFVRGINYDSDPATPVSNGAGKSLIFGSVFNVWRGHPPTSIKKRGNKDLFTAKKTSILYECQNDDGPVFAVEQKPNGYSITKDGENIELTGKTAPAEYVRKLFPLTDIEIGTHVYISSLRDYPILVASDLERLDHIIQLFQLDRYTVIKDRLLQKLREIADLEAQVAVHASTLMTVRERFKNLPPQEDTAAYEKAVADGGKRVERLSARLSEYRQTACALEDVLHLEQDLDRARKAYRKWGVSKPPEVYIKELNALLKPVRAYAQYVKRKKEFDADVRELKSQLDDIGEAPADTGDLDELRDAYDDALRAHVAYTQYVEDADDLKKRIDELPVVKCDDLQAAMDACREDIAHHASVIRMEELLDHGNHSTECPTCRQDVDLDALRDTIRKSKSRLAKLRDRKAELDGAIKRAELEKELAVLTRKAPVAVTRKHVTRARIKFEEADKAHEILRKRGEIAAALAFLKKPAAVEKPDTDLTESEIEDRLELCHDIEKMLAARRRFRVEARGQHAVKEQLQRVADDIADVENRLADARKTVSEAQRALREIENVDTQRQMLKRQYSDCKKAMAEAKPIIEKKRILEVLVKAYGNKGLRTNAAKTVCAMLEANMNLYRPSACYEPFKFQFVVSDKGVSILVDRGNGSKPTDVRLLSGAESESFRLLFALAALTLTPNNRRVNIMVLDEPCAHMCEQNRQLFLERFLPLAMTVVPHIYVITPNADDKIPNSSEWLVVKKNGVSTVKEV